MVKLRNFEIFAKYMGVIRASELVTTKQGDFGFHTAQEGLLTKGVSLKGLEGYSDIQDGNVLYLNKDIVTQLQTDYGFDFMQYSATMYQNWTQIENLTEEELRVGQILHYLSSRYMFDSKLFDSLRNDGEVFTHNTKLSASDFALLQNKLNSTLKIFEVVTDEELFKRILDMVIVGVALPNELVDCVFDFIKECGFLERLCDASIANKELRVRFYEEFKIVPKDFDLFMSYLVYTCFNHKETYVHREVLDFLKGKVIEGTTRAIAFHRAGELLRSYADTFGIDFMAKHVRRYTKELLLIRKGVSDKDTRKLINAVLRKSDRLHVEKKVPIMMRFTSELDNSILKNQPLRDFVKRANNFQLVRIFNALSELLYKQMSSKVTADIYTIRNGKTYFKANKLISNKDTYYNEICLRTSSIYVELLNRLAKKFEGKTVILPSELGDFKVPTSAKAFVGGVVPRYSSVPFDGNSVLGIAWSSKDNKGYCDIDLHTRSISRNIHIGYYGNTFPHNYSGDMVGFNRHGFAAEYIRFTDELINLIETEGFYEMTCNPYSSEDDVKFNFVIGKARKDFLDFSKTEGDFFSDDETIASTMDKVEFVLPMVLRDGYEKKLGYVCENRFIFADLNHSGASRIPESNFAELASDVVKRKTETALSWVNIFSRLHSTTGLNVVGSRNELDSDISEENIIDLSVETLSASKILDIFA